MSDGTHIEWTDASWNPIRARRKDGQPNKGDGGWVCQRVSPGCENCYAATINKRLGTGFDYDAKGVAGSELYLDERALALPLRWKKPRKVFVCSMTDLFLEAVPFEFVDRVFAVMALTPQHAFQLLTKRPKRMREYLGDEDRMYVLRSSIEEWCTEDIPGPMRWPLPNVWLGTSVENQHWADVRIPELLATPAAVRFLSCEPLLGPLDLRAFLPATLPARSSAVSGPRGSCVDWVIVGGESGAGARPFDVAWARSIVAQCRAAGVAVFVKQLGSRPVESPHCGTHGPWPLSGALTSRHGSDMAEWPQDLRVREFPVREWMADSVNRVVTSPQMALGDAS